jgi:hypothetical protein
MTHTCYRNYYCLLTIIFSLHYMFRPDGPSSGESQTGRNFRTRYKEHIQSIRTNNANSRYAQHTLETQHSYGPLEDTMKIRHLDRKGKLMNTWERFHIYKLSKEGIQLNDTYADTHNSIFKIISNQAKKPNI